MGRALGPAVWGPQLLAWGLPPARAHGLFLCAWSRAGALDALALGGRGCLGLLPARRAALSRGNSTHKFFCGRACHEAPWAGQADFSPWDLSVKQKGTRTENNGLIHPVANTLKKETGIYLSALSTPLAALGLILPETWLFTFLSVVWVNSYSSSKCPPSFPKVSPRVYLPCWQPKTPKRYKF